MRVTNLSNIQMSNMLMDLFVQGQMTTERIRVAREHVSSTKCVDYGAAFGILEIEERAQKGVDGETSMSPRCL